MSDTLSPAMRISVIVCEGVAETVVIMSGSNGGKETFRPDDPPPGMNDQPVLFPESVIFSPVVVIIVLLLLFESFTSRYSMVLVPCRSMLHWVPPLLLLRERRLLVAPCNVMVPTIVWVVPAVKVRVSALLTVLVRLLKVVEPEMAWEVPSNVMVPELWVKVPPVLV
ncbi:hypothetical protein IID24_04360 [Patescibacteria group bacterium]|nr:hypothetical protein [Patescibacteria group bacterium]